MLGALYGAESVAALAAAARTDLARRLEALVEDERDPRAQTTSTRSVSGRAGERC